MLVIAATQVAEARGPFEPKSYEATVSYDCATELYPG